MTGVALLLAGPLQSWGGPAPGVYLRPTAAMPSLSAVVGIVANALGRRRGDDIGDLAGGAALASRADRPGTLLDDYHTIGADGRWAPTAENPSKPLGHPVVTSRHYLADAAFVAVYTPPPGGISAEQVLEALLRPARPLYLGRRSCPPAERIPICATGDRTPAEVLETAALLRDPDPDPQLTDAEYFASADPDPPETTVTCMVEMTAPAGTEPAAASLRQDAPHTGDPRRLYHLDRRITARPLTFPASQCAGRGPGAVAALYESLGAVP